MATDTTSTDEVAAYLAEVKKRASAATPGPWRLEYDSCDCGDGYGCSHGSWPHALHLPEPHTERKPGEDHPDYHFAYTEVSEFSNATAEFITHARTDVPRLLTAITRVLARHSMNEFCRCPNCGVAWPCPDFQIVSAALLGEDATSV